MRNSELDEAQALIKIAGENINNLRYADDTTLVWIEGVCIKMVSQRKINCAKQLQTSALTVSEHSFRYCQKNLNCET